MVEIGEQLALPGIPDRRADRLDIGNRENVEQAQAFQRADEARKLHDGARIRDVALLRRLAHLEVMAYQPDDEIGFLIWQA